MNERPSDAGMAVDALGGAVADSTVETSIEAIGLGKVYWDGDRSLEVLKNVSLTVEKGQAVAVLGPSGSGKTTFLNILSGLDEPTRGTARLLGTRLGSLSQTQKAAFRNRHVGFVFQFYHLLPEFSALENVMLPSLISPAARPDAEAARLKASALLEKVGLGGRLAHFPSELSGGEQQRVAVARALMNDPQILFCDEPTGNLDRAIGEAIIDLLMDPAARGRRATLVVTHDERIAKRADRVWDITTGRWER